MSIGIIFASHKHDILHHPSFLGVHGFGHRTQAGVRISPHRTLAIAAYYAAIRAISEDVAKLPLITYRRLQPRGKERAPDHPVFPILRRSPNRNMGSMVFRETLQHWVLGWGNGYAEIQRDGAGTPVALWPIHPSRVRVKVDDPENIRYEIFFMHNKRPKRTIIPQRDMIHVRGLGFEGLEGYSIAHIGAESHGLTMAAQTFGASFFGNGASVASLLESDRQKLTKDQIAQIREEWMEAHGGPYNSSRVAIVPKGITWKKVGIPPNEAQFLETRKFQVEEIARWFRIPPHKIASMERATFSNIDSQSVEYLTDTIASWLRRWEEELNQKLFPEEEQDEFFAEHLIQGFLRGDLKTQALYYKTLNMIGVLSQNDIRERENLNPIEGGDTYFVPLNLVPIEDAKSVSRERARGGQRQAPAPPGDGERRTEADLQRFIVSQEIVFVSVFDRVVQREVTAITRALSRYCGRNDRFSKWRAKYFVEERNFIDEALEAPIQAFLAYVSADVFVYDELIEEHVQFLGEMMDRVLEGRTSEEELLSQMERRSKKMAARILEELTHDL